VTTLLSAVAIAEWRAGWATNVRWIG